MQDSLLQVNNLALSFGSGADYVRVVDGVSFSVAPERTLGIVGESGSGKTVTSLAILRLLDRNRSHVDSGEISFNGRDLLKLPEKEMRKVRGAEISMIFQEPMTALNPVYTAGYQITETLHAHRSMSRDEAKQRAIELLAAVGVPAPEERFHAYPHMLSGGMRQRVMIAIALACDPKLLIADEPTTALDVTIQAQVLELLRKLQKSRRMAMILISHDFGVIAQCADDVAVMYAGKIVEYGSVEQVFAQPQHPYTRGLLRSLPSLAYRRKQKELNSIEGIVPDMRELPPGCRFADRCPSRIDRCLAQEPALTEQAGSWVACYRPGTGFE